MSSPNQNGIIDEAISTVREDYNGDAKYLNRVLHVLRERTKLNMNKNVASLTQQIKVKSL